MSGENESGSPAGERSEAPAGGAEHLNIKVTDNNNEVFFKIKRSTKLEKLMNAFCERQGKSMTSVRFLFEGQRVQPTDTPDTVSLYTLLDSSCPSLALISLSRICVPRLVLESTGGLHLRLACCSGGITAITPRLDSPTHCAILLTTCANTC